MTEGKQTMNKWWWILATSVIVLGSGLTYAKTWEERYEEQKAISDAEIQRRHELRLEEKRLEVLARLERLYSQDIYVSSSSSSASTNETNVKQKVNN